MSGVTPRRAAAFAIIAMLPLQAQESGVAVESGTAAFHVTTNIPAVSVKGKSTAMQGRALVKKTATGIEIQQIQASVPVKSLQTGMSLRDEHMRKYIFDAGGGNMPDIQFTAGQATCPPASNGETTCRVTGSLSIRGVARPFQIALKVRDDSRAFRASGQGAVKLSDYGIEQPSQFGVKTSNDVQIELEFIGKLALASQASLGDRR